jgi:4-diphosphocytidyl-2-C-methyl-D-erythritol kinase
MTAIARQAHAKVNVFLRVLGRRDDGYHDVETLILPISLHDVVTVRPADELSIEVSGPAARGVPDGDANLALRAARALAAEAGGPVSRLGVQISIEKRIPVAAGLGGGSADAAGTLRALDELWGLGAGEDVLRRIALDVGSDVPALLLGEPAYVRGRGEIVEPVLVQTTSWVVRPFSGVSAAEAYAWWDEQPATGPDPGALIAAAEAGNDALLGSALFNDLQGPVAARRAEVVDTVAALLDAGALGAVMSGSGPSVAALCPFASAPDVAAAVQGAIVADVPSPSTAPARSGTGSVGGS